MIGPHEGKELELMLAGEKKLSVFHDRLPADGAIAEEIIPEKAFSPHIDSGQIIKFSKDIENEIKGGVIRFVCYTLPKEEWRAEFFLWLKQELYSKQMQHHSSHDEIIGKLLGYRDEDIKKFSSTPSMRRGITGVLSLG